MAKLVLTVIGDDRPGLVSALSAAVADAGGNWIGGQLARLAGKFAGIVEVEVPDERREAFANAASALGAQGLLTVTAAPVDAEAVPAEGVSFSLHLLGHDRPGIVRQVSEVLAQRGVSIDHLTTETLEAPMAGGLLFEADLVARAPEATPLSLLRHDLEQLGDELMVDIDVQDA